MQQRIAAIGCLAAGALASGLAGMASGQSSRAFYRVEIQAHWSADVHGSAYIASAHFSPLVGMIHSADASMWEPGGIASYGIERMAEAGNSNELKAVADAFVAAGTASERLVGRGLEEDGFYAWNRWFSTQHPLFTIVTMVAPSPDWFMGTHGLSLLDDDGEWIQELVVPLEVYDSGTDSGTTFTAPNADTQPQEPIRNIHQEPPFNGVPPIATITIILQSVEECPADLNQDGTLSPADFNAWIKAFNDQSPAADQNNDGQITPADLNGWIINFNAGC